MKNIFLLIFLFSPVLLQAKKIEVCKSCEVTTIKEAIEIAEDGDEIFIRKGIYQENDIEVNKSLIIYGEEGSIIDGGNIGSILHITSSNFELKNLKIINVPVSYTKDYAAIKVVRSKNFLIENMVLDQVFFGILIEKSHYGEIFNNKLSSTAPISLWLVYL